MLETFLTALFASGLWLLAIAFLGKSLISNWIAKDIELYRGQISAQNAEKQLIVSRVNEKRAKAILRIHQAVLDYADTAKSFVWKAQHVTEDERKLLLDDLGKSATQFRRIYSQNHLYLTKSTCKEIQELFREIQIPAHKFIFAIGAYLHAENMSEEEFAKEWDTAFTSFADKLPPLLEELENQFRKLLGVES